MGVSGAAWASECVKSGMARFPPLAHAFFHIQKRHPQDVARLLRLPPRRGSVSEEVLII